MSVPLSPQLPPGSTRLSLPTEGGLLAAVRIDPPPGIAVRREVLLVPGFTGSKEDFAAVLGPIAAAGHAVTAIDQRGQLDSGGLAEDEAAYGVTALAADVVQILSSMRRPVHLLGHSYGGLVTRAATLTAPGLVTTLTLLGSGPAGIPPPAADRLRYLRPVLDRGGVAAVWAAKEALDAAEPGYVAPGPELASFLRRRYLAMSPACLGGMAQGLLDEPDRVADLVATEVPVLVLHGVDDDAWPPAVQAEMAQRLGARYDVVPAAVHSPAAENPSATVAVLCDFWRSHDGAGG